MKRKAIALALALSMMATMTPLSGFAASVTDFKDVPASSWYYSSVKGALDDGYMNGVSNDTFKPAGNLTRAMFVTMLARFDKATVDNNAATAFADVKTGQWYTGSVAWAVQNGIVTGYSATKFGTDDFIKREDAAVMVYRYAQMKQLKLKEKNSPEFNDQAQISAHAKEAMDYCRKYGIFIGDQNNNVYPQKLITRAEAAAVIERLKNIVDDSQTPVTPPNNNNGGSTGGGGGTTRYNIVWVIDVNGTTQNTTVRRGDKLVPPVPDSAMTRDGYEFLGWSKTENDVPENAIPTADLPTASESTTYYPVWKAKETPAEEFTITWNANGGSWDNETTKTTKVKKGEVPTTPANPTREGYICKGWATSSDATEADLITEFPKVTGDAEYFAVWEKIQQVEEYDYFIKIDGTKGSYALHLTAKDEDSTDTDKARYHVKIVNGQVDAENTDDMNLVSVAKDLCNGENFDAVLNVLRDLEFTYNGTTQKLLDADGKVNDIIVGYMSVAENLPEETVNDIVESIKNDPAISDEIKDSVDTDTVTTLLDKLDNGVPEGEKLSKEETVIAEKLADKLDELTSEGDDKLVEEIKKNETASKLIDQLGITDDEIKSMAKDYQAALKELLKNAGTYETGTSMLAAEETQTASTKGGIPVKVNPAKAAVNLYNKDDSKDKFIDRVYDRLPSQSYVSKDDLKNSEGVEALYQAVDPEKWLTAKDNEYYIFSNGADYEAPAAAVVDALEQIRVEFVKGKDASKIAEKIKENYQKALDKSQVEIDRDITDDMIDKLAEILVSDAPTLEDVYNAGVQDVFNATRTLTSAQAISYMNRVLNRIDSSIADNISEGVKEAIASRAAGTYTATLTLTREQTQPAQ